MSAPARPWLSTLPDSWGLSRLRFVSRLNPSRQEVRSRPPDEAVSFTPMEAVGEWGGLRLDEVRRIADVQAGFAYFRNGDIVVAKVTPCFENGKGALASGLVGGVAFGTTELHVLRAGPRVEAAFLFYLTLSRPFRDAGASEMHGAGGQKRVPEWFFRDFVAPVPPLPAQRRIAAFLDRKTAAIDQLIQKKERLIELLQEKRQAGITQAVTKGLDSGVPTKDSGVDWLGRVPSHWQVAPLYSRFTVQLGKMLDSSRNDGSEGYPYLRNANVQWGDLDLTDVKRMPLNSADRARYRLRSGDLLVCEGGANVNVVGKSAIWRGELEECYYQKALHRVRPLRPGDRVEFLFYALWSAFARGVFIAGANANTVFHLTAEKLREHRFAFPPPDEQGRLVEMLDHERNRADASAALVRKSIARLIEYRQALITAAVTGPVDIPQEVA